MVALREINKAIVLTQPRVGDVVDLVAVGSIDHAGQIGMTLAEATGEIVAKTVGKTHK
jgi:hypothetical protein